MQVPDTSINRGRASGSLRGYTPIQTLFLLRLQSLVGKRQQYGDRIDVGDWRMKLLDKALYSTYCDCVALGIGDEARALLRQARQAQTS
jgi:hypothetical protein